MAVAADVVTASALDRRYLQFRANLISLPALVIEPATVAATLQGRGTVTQSLWISNSGGANLHFALAWCPGVATGAPWLTIAPLTGTVAGSAGRPVQFTFSADQLSQAGVCKE